MTQDEQNIDLLGIFHYVLGGLTAFFSCFFLIYVAIVVLTKPAVRQLFEAKASGNA